MLSLCFQRKFHTKQYLYLERKCQKTCCPINLFTYIYMYMSKHWEEFLETICFMGYLQLGDKVLFTNESFSPAKGIWHQHMSTGKGDWGRLEWVEIYIFGA